MIMYVPSQCRACLHARPDGVSCDAFPSGIPLDIAMGGADHRRAHGGDHGVRFERRDDEKSKRAFAEWSRVFGEPAE